MSVAPEKQVVAIDIVADRTADTRPDEGFLRVRRMTLKNRYDDGSESSEYSCDVVSRKNVDAVAVIIYEVDAERRVRVALKTGVRPPISLRPDTEATTLAEMVAGMLEPEDAGEGGIERRAAAECAEEAGFEVAPEAVVELGAPLFASPGITDEKVHYRAVEVSLDEGRAPSGDGSVMEEAGGVLVLELDEAIRRCRTGQIPDAKTEVALLRLCDLIGYVPQLGCFIEDVHLPGPRAPLEDPA